VLSRLALFTSARAQSATVTNTGDGMCTGPCSESTTVCLHASFVQLAKLLLCYAHAVVSTHVATRTAAPFSASAQPTADCLNSRQCTSCQGFTARCARVCRGESPTPVKSAHVWDGLHAGRFLHGQGSAHATHHSCSSHSAQRASSLLPPWTLLA